MKQTVIPSIVSGTVVAPASKSAMQRACAAALIHNGETILINPGISADDKAALGIIQQLGATVHEDSGRIVIESKGINPAGTQINCGESGLSIRMFTSIAAVSNRMISVTGEGSLAKRPLAFFNEVLPQLGVQCESNGGFLPLKIKGPLQPCDIDIDGSLSSQFLTGLLFAFSAAGASNVSIHVKDLNSKPYIDLTLQVMASFGLKTPVNENYRKFYFPLQSISQFQSGRINYQVESDWSGGAFLLVAGAIRGNITVKGLDIFSSQADKAVLQPLMQCGAIVSITENEISVSATKLRAFHFNANDCPDLFPPLVALAAYCEGTSVIEGVNRLTHKESNRSLTLQEEFKKMGVVVDLQDDLMLINGGNGVNGAAVQSHHDHRIAMACAVAALNANDPVVIDASEAVNKSYPAFWTDLAKLNVKII